MFRDTSNLSLMGELTNIVSMRISDIILTGIVSAGSDLLCTITVQDVNPRTGTRLDCPRPERWTTTEDSEYQCNNINLNTSQLSPRFINRHRMSRTETSPGRFTCNGCLSVNKNH